MKIDKNFISEEGDKIFEALEEAISEEVSITLILCQGAYCSVFTNAADNLADLAMLASIDVPGNVYDQ